MSGFAISAPRLFQFTPLREGRPHRRRKHGTSTRFQFTPLREGRPFNIQGTQQLFYFNSRPCVRGDGQAMDKIQGLLISIHAPA